MGKPLPGIVKYDYLSGELLRTAYQEATSRPLPADTAPDLPRVADQIEKHLLDRAVPLDTAQPGNYLHIPRLSLDLIDRSAGPGSWTAALFTNTQDTNPHETGAILLILLGPIEDCREWITDGSAPKMPLPATPSVMAQVIEALSAHDHSPAPQGSVATLAQALATPSWPPVPREALARVLIREPAQPPYATIVIAVPLWVRTSA